MPKSPIAPSRQPGRPGLTPEHVADTRQRITAAAEALFAAEGYSGVSMRRLGTALGWAPMTIYGYFDSKADILRGIWSRFFAELFDDLERLAKDIDDPAQGLATAARAYVRYWIKQPDRYRMVFMTDGVSQSEVGHYIDESSILDRYALFANLMVQALGPGLADKPRNDALICGLNGIAHSLVTISHHDWEDSDVLVDLLVQALLRVN